MPLLVGAFPRYSHSIPSGGGAHKGGSHCGVVGAALGAGQTMGGHVARSDGAGSVASAQIGGQCTIAYVLVVRFGATSGALPADPHAVQGIGPSL